MIVAFTGGRNYTNRTMVDAILDLLLCLEAGMAGSQEDKPLIVRVGDCPTGLDALVRTRCPARVLEDPWAANWNTFGRAAGPVRNGEMLRGRGTFRHGLPADLLVAFPGGRGTADCVRQARALGIAVIEIPAGRGEGGDVTTDPVCVKKSRKEHLCDWCPDTIRIGASYVRWLWFEHDYRSRSGLETVRMHTECYKAMMTCDDVQFDGFWTPSSHRRGCWCEAGTEDCDCGIDRKEASDG